MAPEEGLLIEQREGRPGHLRGDLEALRVYFQKPTLSEGLVSSGIKRALEVGIGIEFSAIKQLARLVSQEGQPVFTKNNLWAIDPYLRLDERPRYISPISGRLVSPLSKRLDRFTREGVAVEVIAERIEKGGLTPFDLVFSRGVTTIGGLPKYEKIEQKRFGGMYIIAAMKRCLGDNPNALFMISTKLYDTVLPYCRKDLEELGLEVVHYNEARGASAHQWIKKFQKRGLFPDSPEEVFFNLVICKKRAI